ncbi:MAG: ATP-grasp domain-containing protein [Candidatus Thorarchaeota archaeon]
MNKHKNSVLVVGFNTRPIATSLNLAGYRVFTVDFFGDEDLYPFVEDSLIITKEFGANYESMKHIYHEFLLKLSLRLLNKYPHIEYLIIGSGLDDAFIERDRFFEKLKGNKSSIKNLNNDTKTIKDARDIQKLYNLLDKKNYNHPININLSEFDFQNPTLKYPVVLKKEQSSGGVNIYRIESYQDFKFLKDKLNLDFQPNLWYVQEFIEGLPISCTVISDGLNARVISINRQIIGEKFLNAPKDFVYCGNVVPADLFQKDNEIISEISIFLTKSLKLKGINGFDYVLKNHYPYLMEINPRIPGSLRVSESALGINLMDLHIKSFFRDNWNEIKTSIDAVEQAQFATKLVLFASQTINEGKIEKINKIKFVHDKPTCDHEIHKDEPVCTILFTGDSFAESYFGALKIVDKIEHLIRCE